MEIIKIGDLKRLVPKITFECKRCGCIFKADKDEYNTGWTSNGIKYSTCVCPTCNSICSVREYCN